ncbi:MAG: MerR family transcriptional regulator [Thermodesulfobacteriota bacterium]
MGFTTNEILDYAHISARQLRWWEEKRIFKASLNTNRPWARKYYTLEDLICVLIVKSLLDHGVSLYRIRKSVERAKVTGVENPLSKFRVACLANSVVFKKDGKYVEPISGQMVIEEVLSTIRPRLERDFQSEIETIINEANQHFEKKVARF